MYTQVVFGDPGSLVYPLWYFLQKNCHKGLDVAAGALLAKIAGCDHAIVIKELCASCGKDLRPYALRNFRLSFRSILRVLYKSML